MYARLSRVMFPIAALLFVGAIVWGYQEHQEKNAILIKTENQYQRAFHDLTNHLGRLQDELGQTLAVSSVSHSAQRKGLVKVWRLTGNAQNEVNQLPLAMLPFNKASEFLSRVSDFAYRTAMRDLAKQPLTADEIKTMKSLYAKASDLNSDLGRIQNAVLSDHLRWTDVEVAMAGKSEPSGNTIIDGFKAMDKKIGSYPENDWGPSGLSAHRARSVHMLSGADATPDDIRRKAEQFLSATKGIGAVKSLNVTANGQKTDMPSYTATAKGAGGETIQLDYTRKGGELLWYMDPRPVNGRRLDFAAARTQASDFLVRHNYRDMTPVTYDEYDHVAVFTFVGLKDNVRIYPDKLTVRVALDNGEAVGLQAADHVFAPKKLPDLTPKIGKEEAAKSLHPDFRTESYSLAVIENELKEPVLCHEFTGTVNGGKYRIYFNAATGEEETVEKIPETAKALLK